MWCSAGKHWALDTPLDTRHPPHHPFRPSTPPHGNSSPHHMLTAQEWTEEHKGLIQASKVCQISIWSSMLENFQSMESPRLASQRSQKIHGQCCVAGPQDSPRGPEPSPIQPDVFQVISCWSVMFCWPMKQLDLPTLWNNILLFAHLCQTDRGAPKGLWQEQMFYACAETTVFRGESRFVGIWSLSCDERLACWVPWKQHLHWLTVKRGQHSHDALLFIQSSIPSTHVQGW